MSPPGSSCHARARAMPWLALGLVGACATGTGAGRPDEAEVRTADGRALDLDTLSRELAETELVCFGERHDSASDHALEGMLARALLPRGVLGLEMIERDRQPVLDALHAGSLPLEGLADALDFEGRWGRPYAEYASLFAIAADAGAPIVALNARREVVRSVMREGVEAARSRFGDEVPPLQIDDTYRAFVASALAGHEGLDDATRDRFVAAQRTWDETMAARAVEALRATGRSPVFVVAGAMHCGYGLGIPSAARALGVTRIAVVLPEDAELPALDAAPRTGYFVRARSR